MPRATILGLISDTHGLLRPEALRALKGADYIVHAGDIGSPEILDALSTIAPVTAIRGNIDTQPWAAAIPETVTVDLAGVRIHVVHNVHDLAIDVRAARIRLVVSGHSHKPGVRTEDGVVYVNPGSAGGRRFRLPVTVATLELSGPLEPVFHDLESRESATLKV